MRNVISYKNRYYDLLSFYGMPVGQKALDTFGHKRVCAPFGSSRYWSFCCTVGTRDCVHLYIFIWEQQHVLLWISKQLFSLLSDKHFIINWCFWLNMVIVVSLNRKYHLHIYKMQSSH